MTMIRKRITLTTRAKKPMVKHIDNHADWIAARMGGIGGSEAAAVIGWSKFKTNLQLWQEKTGSVKAPDISDSPYVKYGKAAEPLIRENFKLYSADIYTVDYAEFDLHINDRYPFIFATLDGILTDKGGRKGVLEIKTAEINRSSDWDNWIDRTSKEGKLPDQYYIQVLHQLLATGYDFAVVCAQLRYKTSDNDLRLLTLHRHIERKDHLEDMEYLLKHEQIFWNCVESSTKPPLILPKI